MQWTALLALCLLRAVCGDYNVNVNLSSYSNPSHRHYGGGCCDHLFTYKSQCLGDCDNYFVVCVYGQGQGEEEREEMEGEGGYFVCSHSGDLGSHDTISFGSTVGRLPNPLVFPMTGPWTGAVLVVVAVFDRDDFFPAIINRDEFIDRFILNYTTSDLVTLEGYYRGRATLTLSLTVTCREGYYGPDCTVFCEADPSNHTCGSDGLWECVGGWTGAACDVCTPSLNCSESGGYCVLPGECRCLSGFSGEWCDVPLTTSPPPLTPTTVSPTDTTSTPTDTPSTPTDTPSTPTDTPSTPTDTTSTPTDTPSTPTDTTSTPTDTPSTPTDTPSTPTDTTSTPTDTPSTPTDTTSTPTDTTSTPTDTPSTPTDTPSTPDDTASTPTDATSPPINITSTPNDTTLAPTDTTPTPTSIPTDTTLTPTDTTSTPGDTGNTTPTPTSIPTDTTSTPGDTGNTTPTLTELTSETTSIILPADQRQSNAVDVGGVVGGVTGGVVILLLVVLLLIGTCCCVYRRQRKERGAEDRASLVEPLVGENPMYMEHHMGSHTHSKDYHKFTNPLYTHFTGTPQEGGQNITGPPGAGSQQNTVAGDASAISYAYPRVQSHLFNSVYLPGDDSPSASLLEAPGHLDPSPSPPPGQLADSLSQHYEFAYSSDRDAGASRDRGQRSRDNGSVVPPEGVCPSDTQQTVAVAVAAAGSVGHREHKDSLSRQYFHFPLQ